MKVINIKKRTIYLAICLLFICILSTSLSIAPKAVNSITEKNNNFETVAYNSNIKLPIIMYHSILRDPAAACDYVVSPNVLESDIKYLKEHGYNFILCKDLLNYVDNQICLPDNPIMITFDDGNYNNYTYAFEILKKYGAKAIISPIGIQSVQYSENIDENPNYGYCNWDNLKEMYESGIFEIANHSYDLHHDTNRKGAAMLKSENIDDYRKLFKEDTLQAEANLEKNVGCEVVVYTYPFGAFCHESEELLRDLGYRITFITEDRTNVITDNPNSLYKLARYNRPSGVSTEDFMKKVLQ